MTDPNKRTSSWKDLSGPVQEDALRKGYEENGGWYLKLAGQYITTKQDLWRPIIFYADTVFLLFNLGSAGYLCALDGDMEAASECIHFVTMVTNMMVITFNLLHHRKLIDDLFVGLGYGFFDYGDNIDPQTKHKMETYLTKMREKKKFRFRTFVLIVWTLGGALLSKIIVAHFRFGDTNDGEGGAVSRKHIIAQWFFGIDKWPNYIFMVTVTYAGQMLVMNSIWGFVLPVICYAEELTGQLHVVGLGLRHTCTRARHIYTQRYGEFKNTNSPEYAECIREALKSSVQHHNVILDTCNKMRTVLSLPLMTVMFGTAVLLCMSGFIMLEDSVPIVPKIISLLFIAGEVLYSYMFCFYGEMMKTMSEDIGNQLYQDRWRDASDAVRPYFAMINLRSSKAITLSAGGFMEVNLAAFSNIISSSYSYFNLMFSSKA